MTKVMHRPDPRPSSVVWESFEKAFDGNEYPQVSWALGSDWGMGTTRPLTPREYRDLAVRRMAEIYGPKPSALRINPINLVRRR
jgi:hypothetical protein